MNMNNTNTNKAALVRLQRSVDRMESMLKTIDNRVMHLHTKMLANVQNKGGYFATKTRAKPVLGNSLLWKPPGSYNRPTRSKLTILK